MNIIVGQENISFLILAVKGKHVSTPFLHNQFRNLKKMPQQAISLFLQLHINEKYINDLILRA